MIELDTAKDLKSNEISSRLQHFSTYISSKNPHLSIFMREASAISQRHAWITSTIQVTNLSKFSQQIVLAIMDSKVQQKHAFPRFTKVFLYCKSLPQ